MTPHEATLLLYNLALLPVIFFSILFIILTLLNIYMDRDAHQKRKLKEHPFITVQVPSFNDPVAIRCLKACLRFTYPEDRYEIMILDDSTDARAAARLQQFAAKRGLKYIHRTNRRGYKPGALQEAMGMVKGDIIVIFDADFVPKPDFLERIAQPFEDPKVAIVQGRQGFLNAEKNLVSRFASYLLIVHHTILMPINNRLNTVFFCGTAGAIRKSAIEAAGGWNTESITEDSDLSVRILARGYKTVYLPFETPSEVPVTIESFVKQQMRWCFGGIRVFADHKRTILFRRGLTLSQRLMILFMTLGNLVAPAVILMTVAGLACWFSGGDLKLFGISDFLTFFLKYLYTAGFLVMGFVALYKRRSLVEFPRLLLATFSISLILVFANSVAVYKAIFWKERPLFASAKNSWICTAKIGNEKFR
jgi:cellulose synthase/poly-beta-1,6-N-acetylglucosamine synthase-like glycosyltransferase